MEYEALNSRIITARFYTKYQNIAVIQCYEARNVAKQRVKDAFYKTINKWRKKDMILLGEDFSAKVGVTDSRCLRP